ncbi:MAG TPA: DUF5693 family protein [Bacillota bacterium]
MRATRDPVVQWIALFALLVGLAAGAVAAGGRAQRVDAGPVVALLLDYNRLERVALLEGTPLDQVAQRLLDAGVDGFVVRDRTLAELETLGRIDIAWGWELLDEQRLRGRAVPAELEPQRIYVDVPDDALRQWLYSRLTRRWPAGVEQVTSGERAWLSIRVPAAPPQAPGEQRPVPLYGDDYSGPFPRDLMLLPLGIEQQAIERVLGWGARVGVELAGVPVEPQEEWLEGLEGLPAESLLIFKDGQVPQGLAARVADALRRHDWHLGLLWNRSSEGLRAAAAASGGRLIKVHPMWPGEPLDSITNGVHERLERVVYYQRFVTLDANSVASVAPERLQAVRRALNAAGYGAGWPAPLRAEAVAGPLRGATLLAPLGAMLLAVAGSLGRVPSLLLALAGASAAFAAAAGALPVPPVAWQAAAWVTAVLLPLLGIQAAGRWVRWRANLGRPRTVAALGGQGLVIATACTVAGGLAVQALLGDELHTAQLLQFRGVKAALVVPALWLLIAQMGDRSAALHWLRNGVRQPVRFGQLLLLAVGAGVVGLVVLRAGNFPIIPVPAFELEARAWLDAVLGVRPRTKEFLFGHPLLLLALAWAASHGDEPAGTEAAGRPWRWLLPLAAIGQASVMNTFAHLHTPLVVSLVRTWNGLWLGALLGLVGWALLARLAAQGTARLNLVRGLSRGTA